MSPPSPGSKKRWSLPPLGAAAWLGALLLLLLVLIGLVGPLVLSSSPSAQDLDHLLEGPSGRHWLGTDENGCDLLVQMCYGARLLLGLCASVVSLCLGLGLLIGVSAGYLGGWLDEVVMRVIDVLLAFPGILLNIAIVALVPKAGVGVLIFALAVNGWVGYARVARAQVLRVREQEYVLAARSVGCSPWRVMVRHILPNIWSPIIVQATFGFAGVVLVEASLSFLGLGPPVPYTWGSLLAQGTTFFWRTRHLVLVPGLGIALLVLGCNLLGDGLRDYVDPKRSRAR
ncbi:MAG: ABC transporter permease [Deltaproteobacteria bacterium]|jgi:peptide/nickel transport system permease protein|nr:ABC transporter permease [Deltaproteobacteria bacterium]